MNETRRSTQMPIYVCRSVDDTEIHVGLSRSWYNWVFDALCGNVEKKWHANGNGIYVNGAPLDLLAKVSKSCYGRNSFKIFGLIYNYHKGF